MPPKAHPSPTNPPSHLTRAAALVLALGALTPSTPANPTQTSGITVTAAMSDALAQVHDALPTILESYATPLFFPLGEDLSTVYYYRQIPGQTLPDGRPAYEPARVAEVVLRVDFFRLDFDVDFRDEGVRATGQAWNGGATGFVQLHINSRRDRRIRWEPTP